MNRAVVVGGTSGIGLTIAQELIRRRYEHVYLVGKEEPDISAVSENIREQFVQKHSYIYINLTMEDYEVFDQLMDINTLIITAGFGRVATFDMLTEVEIKNLIKVNQLAVIEIVKKYYDRIRSESNFYCAIMCSIAGHVVSPLFSVYGASKKGLCGFIENINIELIAQDKKNRILEVSPGSIKGTKFTSNKNELSYVVPIAVNIIEKMFKREVLYIPQYEEVYKQVIERYRTDWVKYGVESYEYKLNAGRLNEKPQMVVGYLSGTFDLFHIGHLNLLRRAKEQCDYLIVGVHKSGDWKGKETYIPFHERSAILESIKYVDKVVESYPEDCDAWDVYHYNKLFVGSDYKGSDRFIYYEEYFKNKDVEIVYFPYTRGTSSTQLRKALRDNDSSK